MLYKWIHVLNLCRLAFFTQYDTMEIHSGCWCVDSGSFLWLSFIAELFHAGTSLCNQFPHWRISGMFPVWSHRKHNGYEHLCKRFVWTEIFISLGWKPKCTIAGTYGKCIFSCVRSCQTVFQNGGTTLGSRLQRRSLFVCILARFGVVLLLCLPFW